MDLRKHCIRAIYLTVSMLRYELGAYSEIYGYSEKAFLIVPLVAAFLLDVFTMPCIIFFINVLS